MNKLLLLLMTLLAGTGIEVSAQSNEAVPIESKQLGVTFSTLSGIGIHYLVPTTDKDNFKATGIYIFNDDDSGRDSFFSIGAEYQRDLYEDRGKRGHLIVGAHIDDVASRGLYFEDDEHANFFNLGAGFGFDIGSTDKGIILNAHLTYQYTTSLMGDKLTRLGWGGGVGLGFNF